MIDKYDDLDGATFAEFEHEVREHMHSLRSPAQPMRTSSPNACAKCLLCRPPICEHDLHPIFMDVGANIFPYGIDADMLSRASFMSPDLRRHIADRRAELQKIALRFNWQTPASHSGIHELMERIFREEIVSNVISDPSFGAFYDRVCTAKQRGFDLQVLARTGWRNG